jgi:hypothetical protein
MDVKPAVEREFVTRSEAARLYLPGSESSFWRWEQAGLLTPIRLRPRARKLYRVADLKALAARGAG